MASPGERVLYLGAHYHPAVGGAEITDQMLLEGWVASGGSASALFFGKGPESLLRGVEVVPVRDAEAMEREARARSPRLLYSQIGTHGLGLRLARDLGIPVLTCLHDPRPLCQAVLALASCDRNCAGCPAYPGQSAPAEYGRTLLAQFDHILVPSSYMAGLVKDLAGRDDAEVLHPAVDRVEPSPLGGSAIAMATCDRNKGTDLFLRIAERIPERSFLLAGRGDAAGCGYDPRRHPNVEVAGVMSQADFYGRSWLVLMPSRWPEPFGRMAPEAQSAGVLFMGSALGGIPEAAGDAWIPVEDFEDPEAWVRGIRRLEADPALQDGLRERGREAWRRFERAVQVDRFRARVEDLLSKPPSRRGPPRIPCRTIPETFKVGPRLSAAFHASIALGFLGALARALGAPRGAGLCALAVPAAASAVLARHALPLMRRGTLVAANSGKDLLAATVAAFLLAVPLLLRGPRPAWIAVAGFGLMGVFAALHRRRAIRERAKL
jgi:glycosyltransferase involved in cell wall biosynthesis